MVSVLERNKGRVHIREYVNSAGNDPWTPPDKERPEQRLAIDFFTDNLEGVVNAVGVPGKTSGQCGDRVGTPVTHFI